jgi:hypothetical protein
MGVLIFVYGSSPIINPLSAAEGFSLSASSLTSSHKVTDSNATFLNQLTEELS